LQLALALVAIVLTGVAVAALAIANRRLRVRSQRAERRFDLLQHLAPSLTDALLDSTSATCERVLDRVAALVPAQTSLCFHIDDGRLVLGARSGDGYAGFLRAGSTYEGIAIVDAARDKRAAVAVGPTALDLPAELGVLDGATIAHGPIGPAAGSRDRVWALALPLLRNRAHGLGPEVVGVLYQERPHHLPFSADELHVLLTVARLAADALERARFADGVRRDSAVDGLTGLMTPTAFRKRLREEVAAHRDVGLFFIDSDRFKLYNDTCGHAAGDRLLRALAATFADIARRSGGFAGRNGGDEFCIALVDRTKDASVELAEYVRSVVDAGAFGDAVRVTVSIGVAHYPVDIAPEERLPADKLLEIADGLMYEAKRSGRNRVEFLRFRAQSRLPAYPGEGPIPRR